MSTLLYTVRNLDPVIELRQGYRMTYYLLKHRITSCCRAARGQGITGVLG